MKWNTITIIFNIIRVLYTYLKEYLYSIIMLKFFAQLSWTASAVCEQKSLYSIERCGPERINYKSIGRLNETALPSSLDLDSRSSETRSQNDSRVRHRIIGPWIWFWPRSNCFLFCDVVSNRRLYQCTRRSD